MACDNVKNFEVVLADSSVVSANADENPDIFRALKGGGSNFGIVTRFDLFTKPSHQLWYTLKIYNIASSPAIMAAAVSVQKAMENDSRIGFFLNINTGFITAGMLYLGWQDKPPKAFKAFDEITPMQIAIPETNGTHLEIARLLAMPAGLKREVGTSTTLVDAELYLELQRILHDILTSTTVNGTPTSESFSMNFTIQPMSPAAVAKGKEQNRNCMNIKPVSQAWIAMVVQWSDSAEDELARKLISQLTTSIEAKAKERNKHLEFLFMNDASYTQDPLKSYGEESLGFLRAIGNVEVEPYW
ncbi:hypothetical protein G7Y89_g14580 [Cudoniella acicularis]|uniref:Uncharacterized protein n=1 Tax=Cudoniella acicularis TaxID=354080 RepID=A0A8H4QZ34_9HELO|nr:hypothetical protein G7Y89_g14580 [Cudoniella acicularis]